MKKWLIKSKRELYSNRILSVTADLAVNPRNEHESEYYRLEFPHWVNVIAINRGAAGRIDSSVPSWE